MPRGNVQQTKVIYKSATDSFVVFVESEEAVKAWKGDRSIPLAQVLAGFKVFHTDTPGVTGVLNEPSKQALENEFGTKDDDEVIRKILEGGEVQTSENPERHGVTNITRGPTVAH